MAEQSTQDKTEQPTGRRREEARDEGNVAKSQELNSVAVLIAGMIAFKTTSSIFGGTISRFFRITYQESSFMEITTQTLPRQLWDFASVFGMIVMPIMAFVVFAALASNIGQVGIMFAKKALKPQFKKINPLNGIKRMFSAKSLAELFKGIFKIIILALISIMVIRKYSSEFLMLSNLTSGEVLGFAASVMSELTLKVSIALLIMAAADFAFQKYQHEKSLKMTKQEVKDENKQQEGDPQVKGRIKSLQKQMTMNRMMQEVPQASVVVTNPTHIAIALKYEPQTNADAPRVIAKGKEKMAERIKTIARENDVPVVENKPLARSLFEACEIGTEIPVAFYQAVAEVLSQVYQLNKNKLANPGALNG